LGQPFEIAPALPRTQVHSRDVTDFGSDRQQHLAGAGQLDAAAQTAEECRRLLALLPEEQLRTIAVWKLEGFTNEEIAAKIGRSVAAVERKLALIRNAWEKEIEP
jgi:DNA-directed RNA polymerase specialized sigma24 family protein